MAHIRQLALLRAVRLPEVGAVPFERGDLLHEIAFALGAVLRQSVDDLPRELGHLVLDLAHLARRETPGQQVSELTVLRRVHVDHRLRLALIVASVVGTDHDLEARLVREDLGLARGLDDVRVSCERPEGVVGSLVAEHGRFPPQAVPGREGIAVAGIAIGVDQLRAGQGRTRIETHRESSSLRGARAETAPKRQRETASASSSPIAMPVWS